MLGGRVRTIVPLVLTGTAAEVTPVGQIGDYTFEVGDLTRRVATEYEKLVRA